MGVSENGGYHFGGSSLQGLQYLKVYSGLPAAIRSAIVLPVSL